MWPVEESVFNAVPEGERIHNGPGGIASGGWSWKPISHTFKHMSENRDWTRNGVKLWALRVSFPAVFVLQWFFLLEGAYFPKTAPLTRDQEFTCLSLGGHFSFKPPQWPKCHTRFCISHAIENKRRWIRILKGKKQNSRWPTHPYLLLSICWSSRFLMPAGYITSIPSSSPMMTPGSGWSSEFGGTFDWQAELVWVFFPWCPSSSPGVL